jgi:hypothetical protein
MVMLTWSNKTNILELERLPMHAQGHLLFLVERRIENFSALNTLLLSARIGSSLTTQNGVTTASWPNSRSRQHLKILNANYADIPFGKQLSRLRASWEVVRIQQSRFCEFPAFRNLP